MNTSKSKQIIAAVLSTALLCIVSMPSSAYTRAQINICKNQNGGQSRPASKCVPACATGKYCCSSHGRTDYTCLGSSDSGKFIPERIQDPGFSQDPVVSKGSNNEAIIITE